MLTRHFGELLLNLCFVPVLLLLLNRNARKLFEKNALPILNLAGIDVTVIEVGFIVHMWGEFHQAAISLLSVVVLRVEADWRTDTCMTRRRQERGEEKGQKELL